MEENGVLSRHEDDWEVLCSFLPAGWQEQAKRTGALIRCRKFRDAEVLLRTLLIHLADGCSLRETAVRARQGGLATVSDVALLKRLKVAGEWLRWLAVQLMVGLVPSPMSRLPGAGQRIRIIDGSTVQEPGSTGTSWRIHYSIAFPSLACDEVHITGPETGESFRLFAVAPGDLILGDRGYANRANVGHVVRQEGDVLIRLNLTTLPLLERQGARFPLLARLRTLSGTRLGDWEVSVRHEGSLIPGRVCALKKSKQAAERARRKSLKENSKKGRKIRPETLEAAGYLFVFTTLDRAVPPSHVLEMYRGRWQVELAFKRLKSIVGIGRLKKTDLEAARAWIHGKLLVAFLIETLIAAGERFSPWGYPLAAPSIPVAGDTADAARP